MARPRGNRRVARLTVSFDEQVHTVLAELARRQDVSVAWIVRRAVTEFIGRHERSGQPELPLRRTTFSPGAAAQASGVDR